MTTTPDAPTLGALTNYQGAYHNHKEQLGYTAAALYVSGALWVFLNAERWGGHPAWGKGILFLTGVAGLFYVFWQFHLRSRAAEQIEAFLNLLDAERQV